MTTYNFLFIVNAARGKNIDRIGNIPLQLQAPKPSLINTIYLL